MLMEYINGWVGNSEVAGVKKGGIEKVNENVEQLVDVCVERGLFLANMNTS